MQLVVEMRTAETRRLKENQRSMERKLEKLQITQTELNNMKSKVEDLQGQIDQKKDMEK